MNTTYQLARQLDEAAQHAVAVPQVASEQGVTLADAYRIQWLSMDRRVARGEQSMGIKLGFTSRAKMEQMGVDELIWGWLTDDMYYEQGASLPAAKFIHPRAEPEICFVLSKPLDKAISLDEAKDYVDYVALAIEVIDSRYKNFKFSLEDVVADNCSSSGFVVGEKLNVDTDISDLAISLSINGEEKASGSTKAILGNPWESLVEASKLLEKNGKSLLAGAYVMAGAATAAQYIHAGDQISAKLGDGLSEVGFKID